MKFENDEKRREYFLEQLRQKLKDPEFRKIEGFPIGSDEDILTLSDPPYYTACPNPFIAEFIQHYGKPYDPSMPYSREPFAADVSEGKNDPIYNAHSYHTKVPHKAIMRYILHYTEPGDVVFDGFCGTGMTGIAARTCEQKPTGTTASTAGLRHSILVDLSVLPSFIASNLNSKVLSGDVAQKFSQLLDLARTKFSSYFITAGEDGTSGNIQYCVWSDVFICSNCSQEFSYWDGAVSLDDGEQIDPFPCPHCRTSLTKRSLTRAFTTISDPQTRNIYKKPKRQLVYLNYESGGHRYNKAPSREDITKAEELESQAPEYWVPSCELPKQDRFFKDGLHLVSLTNYHRFYFPRTLHVLAFLWNEIASEDVPLPLRNPLRFILTSMIDRNLTIRNRFVVNEHNPRGRINGPLANTLYVPGLSVEQNPLEALAYKSKEVVAAFKSTRRSAIISTQDLSFAQIPEKSVDYIFIDPPFGHNIMYSELNGITEAWLRVRTNASKEAVVSEAQRKSVLDYTYLMKSCFEKCCQILKPGRWMTVEFHNSQNAISTAIQEAITQAGFVIADVRTLDKQKGTINQEYYTAGSVKQDLVISAYKPNDGLDARFKIEAGTEEGVWDFIRTHLKQLPQFVSKNGQAEIIAERQNYLLFDRMVAFHVQHGVTVPLSAAGFYAGLVQRFSERDGMFFLPEQVAEYDKRRMTVREVLQLQLFVIDEASAIQWLKQQILTKPQTFQDIHPQFLKELGGWQKHEKPLELSELLEQNFLRFDGNGLVPEQIHSYLSSNWSEMRKKPKDDPALRAKAKDRWYVPDPNKAGDLEKLRERSLLKEFWEYLPSGYKPAKPDSQEGFIPGLEPKPAPIPSGKKIKVIRLEAVRCGFKHCWQNRDYRTIIAVAQRIPEDILQEDPKLLMWYDQALTRSGEGA